MPSKNRLSPRWRKLLLTVHIVASVVALGGLVAVAALGVSGLNGADPQTVYPAASLVESTIVIPLALVALATGVALATLSRWGLVRFWWVAVKLAVTVILTTLASLGLAPHLAAAAEAATDGGVISDAERIELALLPAAAAALLVLYVALSVFKPTARLRPDRPAPRPGASDNAVVDAPAR